MPLPSPSELKTALLDGGFEVYRSVGTRVILADRVRDNLIMDSGVSAALDESGLSVRVVLHAQSRDFPGESPDSLYERTTRLATAARERGYQESQRQTVPILDPGDRSHTLDTWYEIAYERRVSDLGELTIEVRFAMGLEKAASPGTPG
ncbi:MAG: hypothetical protein OZ921_18760 [Sorangiineae bacterium]|nr:hypothetical protein [Polyangiaceae bacterium]MEB2324564.1 hypothetical protein [Sorangiineae bacterium]